MNQVMCCMPAKCILTDRYLFTTAVRTAKTEIVLPQPNRDEQGGYLHFHQGSHPWNLLFIPRWTRSEACLDLALCSLSKFYKLIKNCVHLVWEKKLRWQRSVSETVKLWLIMFRSQTLLRPTGLYKRKEELWALENVCTRNNLQTSNVTYFSFNSIIAYRESMKQEYKCNLEPGWHTFNTH